MFDALGEIGGRLFNFAMAAGRRLPVAEVALQATSRRSDENHFESYTVGPPLPGGWVDGFTQGVGDELALERHLGKRILWERPVVLDCLSDGVCRNVWGFGRR